MRESVIISNFTVEFRWIGLRPTDIANLKNVIEQFIM